MDDIIECHGQPGYQPYASRLPFIRNCRQFRNLRGHKVRTVDLASFLHKAGVRRVEWFKIDAISGTRQYINQRSLLDSHLTAIA